MEKELIKELRGEFHSMSSDIDTNEVVRFLERNDIRGLERYVGLSAQDDGSIYKIAAILSLFALAQFKASFEASSGKSFGQEQSDRIDNWVKTFALTEATGIVRTSRLTLAGIIKRGLSAGWSLTTIAKAIKRELWMTDRSASAIDSAREDLLIEDEDDRLIDEKLKRRICAGITYRAMMIASIVITTSKAQGTILGSREASESGAIPFDYRLEWVTARDERVCPRCGPMDGVTKFWWEEWPNGISNPPLHPMCRCEIEAV